MEQFISVAFVADDATTAMLTALLMDAGFEGVEELEEETIVTIPQSLFVAEEVKTIFEKFGVLYNIQTIEQQNWNARWESSFEPVRVNDFAAIRASFHPPVKDVTHEIVITPKMSFGTGHHATTYLMIQEMSELDFRNKTVTDFGTGTAVLAILAEKLGAKEVLAIDNDDWSICNARENLAANGCLKITLQKGEEMVQKHVDILLANINLNVIIANIQLIKNSCSSSSQLLLSGLLLQDEPAIQKALIENGFAVVKTVEKNNWIAILAKLV